MADEKYSKKKFGDTYYPITQNEMSNNRFKNFTGDKKFGSREDLNKYHKDLKTKLSKEKVRPSEILKLDKEFKSRMKRANDDLQYKLSNRAGMKEERKKQKGTIPDTGSAFSTGGQMLKGKQKQLDKNKDGKISGEDFKMMKAKYGKMSKAKDGKMIKASLGTMAQDLVKKVFGKKKSVANPGSNMDVSFKGMKLPIATLFQKAKATEQNKAKYGKMMKAGKGGGADIDYRLGTKMQGDYEGKTLTGKAKEFLGTGVKQTQGSIKELRKKLIKKMRGAQVGPAEEAALDKLTPSEVKKKLASMSKAKHGKMIKAKKGKDIDIIEAISNKSLMGQGFLTQMKSAAKSAKKKNMGGEMKSTKGYGAARTSGMGLQDQSLKSGQNYEITKGGDYIKDLI